MNRTAVTNEFSEQESRAENQEQPGMVTLWKYVFRGGAGVERDESRRHQGGTNLSTKPSVGINLMCVKREGDRGPHTPTPCGV